ncbi:MAG: helix-hairpin-helix domain-containing protein [Pseudomonadota bacterium]
MPISILMVKGIGPAAAEKLTAAGFATAEDLAVTTDEKLSAVEGFGASRARQVIAHALQLVAGSAPAVGDGDIVPEMADRVKIKKLKNKKEKKSKKKSKKDKKKKGKKGKKKPDKIKKTGSKKKDKKK